MERKTKPSNIIIVKQEILFIKEDMVKIKLEKKISDKKIYKSCIKKRLP